MKTITDEEIRAEAVEYANQHRYTASFTGWFEKEVTDFKAGAKWYREQMESRNLDREQDSLLEQVKVLRDELKDRIIYIEKAHPSLKYESHFTPSGYELSHATKFVEKLNQIINTSGQ
jgi:hypothetical protein